jgi:hypothetical protein
VCRRGDQGFAADLVEGVLDLGDAICRVDVDQDQTSFRGRELRHHPFGAIRCPDADAIAWLEPERQQPHSDRVDPGSELAIGPPYALMPHDQRQPLGLARRHFVEVGADRLTNQRWPGAPCT